MKPISKMSCCLALVLNASAAPVANSASSDFVQEAPYVELQKQYLDGVETLLDTCREAIAAAAELEELTGLTLLGP